MSDQATSPPEWDEQVAEISTLTDDARDVTKVSLAVKDIKSDAENPMTINEALAVLDALKHLKASRTDNE